MKSKDDVKLASLLSYFLVGLIWFFVDEKLKKNTLVKHHVKQALNLFVFLLAFAVLAEILNTLTSFIVSLPIFGIIIGRIIGFLMVGVSLFFIVAWIVGVIYAINGEKKKLPLIGIFAKKYLKF